MARLPNKNRKKLVVLVSSSVYGLEDILDLVYAMLTKFGYEVWMSHRGTIQTYSNRHAFDNCLAAVRACDIFLSVISKQYGSGRIADELSITHQELRLAIDLKKPRWVLAHHDVVFARKLLGDLGFDTSEKRAGLPSRKGAVIDDLRVIDMYEDATREALKLQKPEGNWAQKFVTNEDALLFAQAQFHRYQEVESFISEHFKDLSAVKAATADPTS